MQSSGTRGGQGPSHGTPHIHAAAEHPPYCGGQPRESQLWHQVCSWALAAAAGPVKSSVWQAWTQAAKEEQNVDPPPRPPVLWKGKCVIPSGAHLHDAHRTSTTFIMGEKSATTLGIQSKIATCMLGPGGARQRRARGSPHFPGKVQNKPGLTTGPWASRHLGPRLVSLRNTVNLNI